MFRQAPKLGKRKVDFLYKKLTANPQVFASTEVTVYFGKKGLRRFEHQFVQTGRRIPADLLPADADQVGVTWKVFFPSDAVDVQDLPLGWRPEGNRVVISGSELAIYLLRQRFTLASYPKGGEDDKLKAAGQLTLESVLS